MPELKWDDDRGVGFVDESPNGLYDRSYFREYQRRDRTEIGRQLTEERALLVQRHVGADVVVDVGIGGGAFVSARRDTFGYDVNPDGEQWLRRRHRWWDIYARRCESATFWDSLEHIRDMDAVVAQVRGTVFISMPIYESREHCLGSKHYKPGEHLWYFTLDGLVRWFRDRGFACRDFNEMEVACGREGIGTFVFRRK